MQFYLSADESGHVILDVVVHGTLIDHVDADPEYEGGSVYRSAWQVARDRVSECSYICRPGYGFYLKGCEQCLEFRSAC